MDTDKQHLMQYKAWLLREKYNGAETEEYTTDCLRLERGEPLAYVIAHVPFLEATIYLDSYPLIPRPETEFWVEKAIQEIGRVGPKAPLVLDLCAGSGCIGIAVAKQIPTAQVTFAELKEEHLPTIEKNVSENNINPECCSTIQSNLFENVEAAFDFILSNPPYIDPVIDRAEDSVKKYEPPEALYGGRSGLDLIKHIVAAAPAYLNPNGQLWLEHEPEHVTELANLAKAARFTIETHTDQYNVPRYSVLAMAK